MSEPANTLEFMQALRAMPAPTRNRRPNRTMQTCPECGGNQSLTDSATHGRYTCEVCGGSGEVEA